MSFVRALPLLLLACASAPAPAPLAVNAPSLRAALPAPASEPGDAECPVGRCATTGREVRLTYNPRAAAVTALYERYLRAIYDRSTDALRPLLADFVAPIQSGDSPAPNAGVTREAAIASHLRLFQSLDTGGRAFPTLYVPPRVVFSGERGAPSGLRPPDSFAAGDTSGFRRSLVTSAGFGMPPALIVVVRFVDDEPRIVAVSSAMLSLRP